MTQPANVIVHIRDASEELDGPALQEAIEHRCQHLATEFHEADRFEVTISPDGNAVSAHARASGKKTDVSSHAEASDERQAADAALDRLERELRSRHDKRIFAPRRDARRSRESEKAS